MATRRKERLRAARRSDDANAFIPDPDGGPVHTDDDLAETLAEGFVQAATTGENVEDELLLDGVVPEEIGGPFIESSAGREFARGTDAANPADAEPEPLPRAVAGLVDNPPPSEDPRRRDANQGADEDEEDRDDHV